MTAKQNPDELIDKIIQKIYEYQMETYIEAESVCISTENKRGLIEHGRSLFGDVYSEDVKIINVPIYGCDELSNNDILIGFKRVL